MIPYFDYALDMILDVEPTEILSDDQQEMIENDAENLFGLIHSRYILTTRGLQAMLEKYRLFHFGRCPRIFCRGQACLPIGISDVPNEEAVKLYCPKCEDIYHTRSTRHEQIDGTYTWLHSPRTQQRDSADNAMRQSICIDLVHCAHSLLLFSLCLLFVCRCLFWNDLSSSFLSHLS